MNNFKQVEKAEYDKFVQQWAESYIIPSPTSARPDEKVYLPKDGNYPADVKAYETLSDSPHYFIIV